MIGLEFVCQVFKIDNKELAAKLKIAPPNISTWFKGTREIPHKYLSVLTKIFRGLSSEYFQKELTYIDEIRIRIHHIETMDFEDRHGELVVYEIDNTDKVILDEYFDDYEKDLEYWYKELNQTLKINSYQDRVKYIFETIWTLDADTKKALFLEKNAEEYVVGKLNSYLDLLVKFEVQNINVVESIVRYFIHYHGLKRNKWQEQDLFPNDKLLDFYKDFEDILIKHEIIVIE
ncbi:hypothetical protein [Paenibacillus paridis]|uniref:hypothetical protein n=1 Tax=Paenibacillus paridis TaxID=2583376 RepID=UPI00112439CE|nr:hypothetical protein [Paenibacillus paridis]